MTGDQAASLHVTSPGSTASVPLAREVSRRVTLGRTLAYAAPAVWVVAVLLWERSLPSGTHVLALLAATPALACAGTGGSTGIWLGGGCALLALGPLPVAACVESGSRAGTGAAILCVAVASCWAMRRRARLADELERTREAANAAQQCLIRPLPPRVGGFAVAAGYLSAARGAAVGGDLYDAVATEHGVRIVIGDVRGHGLGAVSTVAAVLGSFREAAHDEPRLGQVLRRLERGLERHLSARREEAGRDGGPLGGLSEADEEFVTVLLLEVRPGGAVTVLNCGHPWPYRLAAGEGAAARVGTVCEAEPLPPLGLFPLPPDAEPLRLHLPPGDALFLHTDGAEDARDADGEFFAFADVLSAVFADRSPAATPAAPAEIVASMRQAVLSHAGARLSDDVALLALCEEGCRAHAQPQRSPAQPVAAGLPCSCP